MCKRRLRLLPVASFLGLFFLAAAFSWAEDTEPTTSPLPNPPLAITASPRPTPLEIASELYKHTGTLADGLTELAKESARHTNEQENDTKKASELVTDSSDMQSSRDTVTNSLERSTESSAKAESLAEETIKAQATALSTMKRSRDFWRTSTAVSTVLGIVFVLASSL
jgi:hypothetical protein